MELTQTKQGNRAEGGNDHDYIKPNDQPEKKLNQKHLNRQQEHLKERDVLIDSFGRIARKLRISVTDKCNMQCKYCMPQDKVQWLNEDGVLKYDEITRLVSILADLGIEKIRLTGGEPLLRPNLEDLITSLTEIDGIKSISMTTNGLLLGDKASQLKESGLDSVNISLDTFRPDRFKAITGIDGLDKVSSAIEAADNIGLKPKINTVVIRGWNEDEVMDFANFARKTEITVRFIEFMPLDGSGIWQPDLVYSKREMIDLIVRNVGQIKPLSHNLSDHGDYKESIDSKGISSDYNDKIRTSDPATLYTFSDDEKGIIGFIPSMTEPFCARCDRARLTSDGRFLTCLFENPGYDLRNIIRSNRSDYYIKRQLLQNMRRKPEGIIKIINMKALKPSLNLMHTIGG